MSAFGQGSQRPGKVVSAIAIAGASEVDFCQAQLEEGVTSMTCLTFLGTSQTVTPSEIPVTLTGLSILGVRSIKRQLAKEVPPGHSQEPESKFPHLCWNIQDNGQSLANPGKTGPASIMALIEVAGRYRCTDAGPMPVFTGTASYRSSRPELYGSWTALLLSETERMGCLLPDRSPAFYATPAMRHP